jgi:hypothetical protein
MVIKKSYTKSLHEKAGLRKHLESWRGKSFTEEEAKGFDIEKLLGVYCMINVTSDEHDGKTYSNVAAISPLPSALKNAKPAGVHPFVVFDIDAPDMAVYATFHEKTQEYIASSTEWKALQRGMNAQQSAQPAEYSQASSTGIDDDPIPF